MPSDKVSALLNDLGQVLAEDRSYPLSRTLLLAEVDHNFVRAAVFRDRDQNILYSDLEVARLGPILLDLWNAEEPEKRWTEIEYLIAMGKFEVKFLYAHEIDVDEDPLDRRDRTVANYFGEKSIVYPPPPDDAIDFKLRPGGIRPAPAFGRRR